jgi:putative Holliday junction resolvase
MTVVFARGVRLGVDVGTVRVGVAVSDPDCLLASPLVTLSRDNSGADSGDDGAVASDMGSIAAIVRDREVVEIVVGLPITLAGKEGLAAASIRQYVQRLATVVDPIPVRLADERMSTAVATRRLSERGVRGRRQRAVVDQAAAVEILQGWLDALRRQT